MICTVLTISRTNLKMRKFVKVEEMKKVKTAYDVMYHDKYV